MKNKGFSLMSAIFVLVVLSVGASFLISITGATQTTLNWSLLGTKAYFGASSGLEWGIRQVVNNPSACPASPTTLNFTQGGLNKFKADVTCSLNSYTEGTSNYNVFLLSSTSSINTLGSIDYATRTLQVSVTLAN